MAHKTRTMVLQQSDEGEHRLELPVNPRTVVISRPQNLLRYQTIDGESIQAARGKGLTQVALETFLPGESSRFYRGTAPEEALALLRQWKENGTPVRLMISGTELDELFLLAELRQSLQEGDADVGIVILLKEYRFLSLGENGTALQGAGGLLVRADERETPAVYITGQGEDLWTISRRLLGDGSRWKELARRNGISDPHGLPKGKEIWLT